MSPVFVFDEARFNRLFPFYILINRELRVSAAGNSIQKLCAIGKGDDFKKHFSIPRPYSPVNTFNELLELQNQLVVIDHISGNKKLRGQFEYLDDAGEILFIGSPWFGSMEQVRENNLQITDFAHHDPLIDLLHVLKAQEINNDDLKKLVATFNKQKQELKKANREIHDIALFPTQNPDPLIRINFDGDVLLNNPAASLLDFFEYKGNLLRNDIFFKIIADQIDHDDPRWVIEAASGNRVYSFLCVTMKEEGYINIYSRDITEKKKINDQLARLSLVARANKNGVLFTSPLGYITWANEGFCNMTGYTLDEVIGKSPVELCQGPLTDENTLAALLDSFFQGKGFNTDIIYYKKDRSWFWGHSFSQPLRDEQGNITEFFGIIQDVTAEKASAEKMKVLSQIAEDNINAVVIADKEGKITWANKSFTTMTGYSLEEATGKKPGHLLQGAETDKKTVQYLATQIAKGEPFNTEILNYKKNGQKYWLRIQGQSIKNEKGAITGYFALEEDITKEKESEDRFRKALEHIGDNVWEHDFRTGTTYFSKSENQFLGYSKEELVNNRELWWNSVHADDRHLLEESDHKYKNGKASAHNLEYRMVLKDGSIRWVLDRGVVIEQDITGKPLRITGTHTDITNSKHTEAELANRVKQFQSLSENIPGAIYEFAFKKDGTDGLRYISPAIEKLFGIKPEDFINYLQYIHPADREMILQKNLHSRQTLTAFYAEARLTVPGQPERWLSVHSSFSYRTEEGDDVFTGFMLDITQRKNAEQELIASREHAEMLAKAKENFLANMSHEIRTPMNAIMGMGNQLAKTTLNRQQHFYLGTINTAAENLLVIINDILDLTKIEAGKLTIERIGFEPKKVVGNAIQVLMHKAEEKGLRFANSFCDNRLSEVLIGDPYRLNQVMLNLISNAIKFTEKGSVDVTCEVIKESETTQTLKCSVTDTGIGMEQKFVEKLFDKFSQEYESVTRKYGGTGLGMSICKELVGLMGGSISVISEKGKGTTIQFVIEFAIGARADLPASHSTVVTNNFLQGKTILVTDDNEMNRLVASIILQNYGAEIVEADNGEQAVQTVINKKPDLVLMDIQMPVMNGYEAAKQLRELGYRLPVIALTANASRGENEKCLAAGMNDYISKPFREDEFLKMIAQWLNTELVITEKTGGQQHDNSKPTVLFDLSSLQAISQGKEEFVHKMLRLFIEQAPATLTEIKQAYAHGEWEKVKKLAHRLKPSIDSLGIHSIKNEIREIEKNAVANGPSEQLNSLVGQVEQVIQQVTGELKNYLNNQQA